MSELTLPIHVMVTLEAVFELARIVELPIEKSLGKVNFDEASGEKPKVSIIAGKYSFEVELVADGQGGYVPLHLLLKQDDGKELALSVKLDNSYAKSARLSRDYIFTPVTLRLAYQNLSADAYMLRLYEDVRNVLGLPSK